MQSNNQHKTNYSWDIVEFVLNVVTIVTKLSLSFNSSLTEFALLLYASTNHSTQEKLMNQMQLIYNKLSDY